ncbi:MAG TPA: thiamine phosphate synthase [Candidatus Omnitrophota bacterium]|nr:thiamine phosphate synthase [Candidatus Omnitrophota bacterium]
MRKVLLSALKGGVDLVELRDKTSTAKEIISQGKKLFLLCRRFNVPFIINDRLDIALALGADGLHVGQEDLPVPMARKALGKNKIIGLSCHSIKDILNSKKICADYVGFGPVFKTKTKPKASPLGIEALKKAAQLSNKPVFAIGGITKNNINLLNGIERLNIAVCREICSSKNPNKSTADLKKLINHV